jgi:hypothetical protein
VLAQALLGGVLVKLVDPKVLAVAHASLAQVCFGLTVGISAGYYADCGKGSGLAPRLAVVVLFAQAVLGAALRHHAVGLAWHIAGALAATGVVMWASLGLLIRHLDDGKMPPPAVALLVLAGVQIFSGIAAYAARVAAIDDPQPMPLTVWATVAHVVLGSLVFGAAIVLAMEPRA